MSGDQKYMPGSATGAEIKKAGEQWTLVLVRKLRHSPEKVWSALTEQEQLRQWAPFDADRNLDSTGPVKLATIGAPHVTESVVVRADAPKLLEYDWGGNQMRWQLEAMPDGGTRLTLWHNIDRGFIAWGAAGWHICFDVLERLLGGAPIGRIVGADAMNYDWQRLNVEYSAQFGVEARRWPTGEKI